MANAITRRVLMNGSRNYIVLFNIVLDGATLETATRINAVTGDIGTDNKVVKLVANLPVDCDLLFDATTDVVFQSLQSNMFTEMVFRDIGGIVNNGGAGKTGDILLTTNTNGNAGEVGTIILWMQKK